MSSKKVLQKVFIILSGGAFVSLSVVGVLSMLRGESNTQNTANQEQLSPEVQLQEQAEGYKLVLAREPDNPFVIENLLRIYLQQGNLSDALPLAEKLVTLQPENASYQDVVGLIKQGLAQQESDETVPSESGEVVTPEEEK